MPAYLAILARQLIIMIIQTAIFAAADKLLTTIVDKMIAHNAEVNGLEPDDAKIATANMIIDIALMAGITMFSLKSKLPVKVAEKLGFTSKGYTKRNLSAKGTATLKAKGVTKVSTNATVEQTATEIAATVAATKGKPLSTVKTVVDIILKVMAVPVGLGLVITNTMDFGAWPSSSYQTTVQKFLSKFGLEPDKETVSSKVLSDDMWKKIYATYVQLGATGINNPYTNQSQAFSRETLMTLVDKVAANIIAEDGKATFKQVFAATQGFIVMNGAVTDGKINSAFGTTSITDTIASLTGGTTSTVKVYTGIVSQGVLGEGLVFTERQDDMIESMQELREAASNNLASYLNTLLGKIVYEVKIVNSIITAEGFRQTGETQKVSNGTDWKGDPKYKTITNKFATIVIYALTDKGSRAKLKTIVLGPTDSAKLRVAQSDLRELETDLPSLVTTTDINEINEIKTETDTVVTKKEETKTEEITDTNFKKWIIVETRVGQFQLGPFITQAETDKAINEVTKKWANKGYSFRGTSTTETNPRLNTFEGFNTSGVVLSTPTADTVNSVSGTTTSVNKPGASATTLSEWYQAQGQTLPSVSARSVIYEGLGLGSRSYYTGTAEQNTKLLKALKAS